MRIKYHREFLKNYRKKISPYPKLEKQFKEKLGRFVKDPKDPSLRDHKLIGKRKDFRAFSVAGDIRVVYTIISGSVWLYDIGTHNQIY